MPWFKKSVPPPAPPKHFEPRRKVADLLCAEMANDHLRVFQLLRSGLLRTDHLMVLAEIWYWRAFVSIHRQKSAALDYWEEACRDQQLERMLQYFDASPCDKPELAAMRAARLGAWAALTTEGPQTLAAEEERQLREIYAILDIIDGVSDRLQP